MINKSNEGIMSNYLVRYGALKHNKQERSPNVLEIAYMTERFRAGDDLMSSRQAYSTSVWDGVPEEELDRRLADVDEFMKELAYSRARMWGTNFPPT